jgi:hypothetical protein
MRAIHVGLILVGLALILMSAGCGAAPASHSPNCGPEGCPIPDAHGKIAPRPTTRPASPMSPISPKDLMSVPSKG